MANRNPILQRPQWVLLNQLTMPLVSYDENKKATIRGLIQLFVPLTIFLDTLFDEKAGFRSFDSDQYQVFKTLEGALQSTGVDGKGCLLRTICEMQQNPIGEFTMMGEIATILLTPKRGMSDFLHEYLQAELIGQSTNMSCAAEFPTCPLSIYNLFKLYGKGDDGDLDEEDNEDDLDEDDFDGDDEGASVSQNQFTEKPASDDNTYDKASTVENSIDNDIDYVE